MNESVDESVAQTVAALVRSQENQWTEDHIRWLLAIPLALIVSFAFFPILDNGFLYFDDATFVDNPYFRGLGIAQVKWAWTTFWTSVYQPLAWMFFEVQYVFCRLDPRGYHLTSLVLHVVNSLVLYLLTVALLVRSRSDSGIERPWTLSVSAALATALFAVHPLPIEAVATACCQPYLPCALFCMLAVLAYLCAFWTSSTARRGWLVGSFFLFLAALLFKAPAVSLPWVLLIVDVYPLRRLPDEAGRWFGASAWRALVEKAPFMMASLLFMGLAIVAKPNSTLPVERSHALSSIARACYAICWYPLRAVTPLDVIALHPPPGEPNWLAFPYSASIVVALTTTTALFLFRRRWPALFATWLIYLMILIPSSGLVTYNEPVVESRYSYMSLLAWVPLIAAGFHRLLLTSSRSRPVTIGVIAAGLGAAAGLAAVTRNHVPLWHDTMSLSSYGLAHGAGAYHWFNRNLGIELEIHGKHGEAVTLLTEAVRLKPDDVSAHINLGLILSRQGKYAEAVAHFAEVVRIAPECEPAQSNWAKTLYNQGDYEGAVAHLTEALRLNPRNADAHNSLGIVLGKLGKHDEAFAQFTESLRLNPGFGDARNNLATVLAGRGKYAEAEAQYAEVVRLNSQDDSARNNLGDVLSKLKKYDEAVAQFNEALRLNPGSIDAHYNLGLVFSHLGNYEAAKAQYAEAIRLQPSDPRSFNASAMIMAACPDAKFRDGKEAVRCATRACDLTQWKNPIVLDTLAAAQAEAGDFDAAVKSQKRAIELLTNEPQKADYRSRLMLYEAKRPYRQVAEQPRPK